MYDPKQKALIERVLSMPEFFPDAYKSWLVNYLTENVNLRLASYQLPAVNLPTALALVGGWADLGGSYTGGTYYKDPFGVVHLVGTLKNAGAPAAGSTIATIPFFPPGRVIFPVTTSAGIGRVDVDATGALIYMEGGFGFFSLSGITFRAA